MANFLTLQRGVCYCLCLGDAHQGGVKMTGLPVLLLGLLLRRQSLGGPRMQA